MPSSRACAVANHLSLESGAASESSARVGPGRGAGFVSALMTVTPFTSGTSGGEQDRKLCTQGEADDVRTVRSLALKHAHR